MWKLRVVDVFVESGVTDHAIYRIARCPGVGAWADILRIVISTSHRNQNIHRARKGTPQIYVCINTRASFHCLRILYVLLSSVIRFFTILVKMQTFLDIGLPIEYAMMSTVGQFVYAITAFIRLRSYTYTSKNLFNALSLLIVLRNLINYVF